MQLINVYISSSSISHIHERASGDLLSEDCCALYTSTAVRARQINVFASTWGLAVMVREMKMWSLRLK